MNELGVAGWLFHRSILNDKTMTLLELPAACKALGVGTVELVSTFFASQHAKYLNELRAAIAENGLAVRSIAVDMGNIANPDAEVRRTDIEALKQWFYTARALGCQAIRVNSGAASPDDQEAIARITEGYRELAAEAAHSGVYLLIENHGGASADPKNIRAFLEGVNSPWFRSCPDTGNFPGDTWREGVQVMAPYAFSCHIKAFTYSSDGSQSWTGRDGQPRGYDLKESLRILKSAGYAGPLCIEAGASATELASGQDAIAYVRELLSTI
ncbi:MAG TPA: sugar phosphate isomerase/epimerase family protein [Chloroflexota bacterium]|nr:sugar phosphate isomerase/epimerase family protein [Chloroflexota bacterium]